MWNTNVLICAHSRDTDTSQEEEEKKITIPKHSHIENLDSSNIIVNHWIQLAIKFVLEMKDFSISEIMLK